jgi:hypothetical protein
LTVNGSATQAGNALVLTDGQQYEAASAFYSTPVNVQSFTTDFTFRFDNAVANGITFTIQNAGPGALGAFGYSLGYGGIGKSVALKFDLRDESYQEVSSAGLYTDGAVPALPEFDLPSGVNLLSGDPFDAHLTYSGTTLNLTLTDLTTLATYSHAFTVDIPATVGGNTAYVGFTGGTGMETAVQQVLTWTFSNP